MESDPPIKILFVEDRPPDTQLAERELRKNDIPFDSMRVDTKDAFLSAMDSFEPDIVISDYAMPEFDGMSALTLAKAEKPFLPFIVLTGSMNEETAIACMKAGADDYVIKENVSRLPFAVREAIAHNETVRKNLDQEIRIMQSEARYRSIFTNAGAIMLMIDPDNGSVFDVNEAATAYYGWAREEFIGKDIAEINTMSPERVRENTKKAEKGDRKTYRFKHRHSDGSVTDVESRSGPVSIDGKTCVLTIVHDITERIAVQAEHDVIETRLSHYLTKSPTITYSMRLKEGQAMVDWVSENVMRILGYSVQETTEPDWWFTNVHQADRAMAIQAISELVKTGSVSHEYRFSKKDRSLIWLADEMRMVQGPDGNPEIIGTMTEITERKRAEEETFLKSAALEAADNAVVITSRDGTVEWVNPAFSALSGYSKEEAMGEKPRELVKSGKQDASFYARLWETIVSGAVWQGEILNRRKNGELYLEEMTITPVTDSAGAIAHFIAIKRDITEKAIRKERVEAALLEKETLLLEVHHRIMNNLQVITGLLDISSGDAKDTAYRASISNVIKSIRVMALLHEMFYKSANAVLVDFGKFSRQLAIAFLEEYGRDPETLDMTCDTGEIILNMDTAIPAGLVLAELLAISLAASSSRNEPDAAPAVTMRTEGGDTVEIRVSGGAIPVRIAADPQKKPFVAEMTAELLGQLGGTVSYAGSPETTAILRFPAKAR